MESAQYQPCVQSYELMPQDFIPIVGLLDELSCRKTARIGRLTPRRDSTWIGGSGHEPGWGEMRTTESPSPG